MRIFLAGVACVGKSTIGACLAKRLDCAFYDLDEEIETYFGAPLQALRAVAFTRQRFRKRYAGVVLTKLITEREPRFVMAPQPSGLQDVMWDVHSPTLPSTYGHL
jgi:shikimate kinase